MKTILRDSWPRVSQVSIRGHLTYMIDARPRGKRRYLVDPQEAVGLAEQLAMARVTKDPEPVIFSTRLRVVATEGTERLKPYGKTLRDAVDHYLAHLEDEACRQDSLTVAEAVRQYVEARRMDAERGELSRITTQGIGYTTEKFVAKHGD